MKPRHEDLFPETKPGVIEVDANQLNETLERLKTNGLEAHSMECLKQARYRLKTRTITKRSPIDPEDTRFTDR